MRRDPTMQLAIALIIKSALQQSRAEVIESHRTATAVTCTMHVCELLDDHVNWSNASRVRVGSQISEITIVGFQIFNFKISFYQSTFMSPIDLTVYDLARLDKFFA